MDDCGWGFISGMIFIAIVLSLGVFFIGNPNVSRHSQLNLQRCLVSVPDGCYVRTVRSPEANICSCTTPLGKLEYQIDWDR